MKSTLLKSQDKFSSIFTSISTSKFVLRTSFELVNYMQIKDCVIPIHEIKVNAYTIPTDFPESDGTLEWDSTTVVIVHVSTGDVTGFGYSYAPAAAASFIKSTFSELLIGMDAMAISAAWNVMRSKISPTWTMRTRMTLSRKSLSCRAMPRLVSCSERQVAGGATRFRSFS